MFNRYCLKNNIADAIPMKSTAVRCQFSSKRLRMLFTGLESSLGRAIDAKLNKLRKAGSAFPRLQVGLQAVQEVFPIPARLFICLINLDEPIMREDHLCPVVDRCELPGDAGPCPLWRALPGDPVNFRSFVHFGHLKLKDTCGWPKAKFGKRAHLWLDSRLVCPPTNDSVRLGYGSPDALRGSFYGEFFDNS